MGLWPCIRNNATFWHSTKHTKKAQVPQPIETVTTYLLRKKKRCSQIFSAGNRIVFNSCHTATNHSHCHKHSTPLVTTRCTSQRQRNEARWYLLVSKATAARARAFYSSTSMPNYQCFTALLLPLSLCPHPPVLPSTLHRCRLPSAPHDCRYSTHCWKAVILPLALYLKS